MKRNNTGLFALIVLALLPVFLWFYLRAGTPMFSDYAIATRSLGQLFGLVGMTLFCLTFVLATRTHFLEKMFGGLDRLYKIHHISGVLAFILVLFHPIMLVLNLIPSEINRAAMYLLPGIDWSYNFGIIALLSMILLIILTLFVKLRYQNWKISHKFMGVVFVFAFLHTLLIPSDIAIFPLLRAYIFTIAGISAIAIVYTTFLKERAVKRFDYQISSVSQKENITTIKLKARGERITYRAGQFIFIRFNNPAISHEQHPFTLASSPKDEELALSMKSLGDFTEKLGSLKVGDKVEIEGPYGVFNYANMPSKRQIWLAGGIGITPFLSMAKELSLAKEKGYNIDLYYCTRTENEAIFLKELKELESEITSSSLRIIPRFSDKTGYLSVKDIEQTSLQLDKTSVLLCGPPQMMQSVKNQLLSKGVSKDNIFYEEFNLK